MEENDALRPMMLLVEIAHISASYPDAMISFSRAMVLGIVEPLVLLATSKCILS